MIPISDTVEQIVRRYPLIEEGLARGFINLSAFARSIKPEIEERHLKKVTNASVIMALTRLSRKLAAMPLPLRKTVSTRDITVETNLTEYVFNHQKSMVTFHKHLVELMEERDECMNYSQGLFEVTVLVSSSLETEVEKLAKGQKLIRKMSKICAITLRMEDTVHTPGVYYAILKALAWENINLLEVISVYSELTLLFEQKDIDKAFSVISGLVLK